jgi:hypothetical protein
MARMVQVLKLDVYSGLLASGTFSERQAVVENYGRR